MVNINSVSYPYLSVAQQCEVPHGKVLAFVDILETFPTIDFLFNHVKAWEPWQIMTVDAWAREKARRKRVAK